MDNFVTEPENVEDNYKKGKLYWENVSPDVSGMLGGWVQVNSGDIEESRKILRQLLKPIKQSDLNRPLRALDCGAGIGRVTKYVLSKFFDEIDLLEQNETFIKKSKEYLGVDYLKIKNTFAQGMQEFQPLNDYDYDCIWGQWVYGYLTDKDLIIFLRKCSRILSKPNGIIVIKDNVSRDDKMIVDEEDGFMTRSESHYLQIFDQVVELEVKHVFKQKRLPKELLPVKMFVLTHRNFESTNSESNS